MILKKKQLLVALIIFNLITINSQNAIIVEQSGNVSVTLSGSENKTPAKTGQSLKEGDSVSTGEDGTALLLLTDGTRLDLFSNSRMKIRSSGSNKENNNTVLSKLWSSIKGKFSDSQFSSAQAGGVGAFRSANNTETLFNDKLTDKEILEMDIILKSIIEEDLPENASSLLEAIVYESYGQFISANKIYSDRIDLLPEDPTTYDMLFDMYLKIDFYNHADDVINLKKSRMIK